MWTLRHKRKNKILRYVQIFTFSVFHKKKRKTKIKIKIFILENSFSQIFYCWRNFWNHRIRNLGKLMERVRFFFAKNCDITRFSKLFPISWKPSLKFHSCQRVMLQSTCKGFKISKNYNILIIDVTKSNNVIPLLTYMNRLFNTDKKLRSLYFTIIISARVNTNIINHWFYFSF